MNKFKLTNDDYYAIYIAQKTAKKILTESSLKPNELNSIKHALDALNRLPEVTVGAFYIFGFVYRYGDDSIEEMKHIDFKISEDTFEISIGGSVYDRSVGGDSYAETGWDTYGNRRTECQLAFLEDIIREFLSLEV